jgi:hypothetical protein
MTIDLLCKWRSRLVSANFYRPGKGGGDVNTIAYQSRQEWIYGRFLCILRLSGIATAAVFIPQCWLFARKLDQYTLFCPFRLHCSLKDSLILETNSLSLHGVCTPVNNILFNGRWCRLRHVCTMQMVYIIVYRCLCLSVSSHSCLHTIHNHRT